MLFELYDYGDNLPDWSLPYIVNGDASALSDEERARVDTWLSRYPHRSIIDVKPEHAEFTHRPAFGLACSCVPFEVHAPRDADEGATAPRVSLCPVIS